jgi:hypothetical protein
MRNLSFIMLNVMIHGVAQETRPVACVLDLEGVALIARGLVALFYLFYFSNCLLKVVAYVGGVPDSCAVASFTFDAYTRSFFAFGSA